MTQAVYLVTKNTGLGSQVIDGLFAMAINLATGQTNAQICAAADAAAIAVGKDIRSPYFETVLGTFDLSTGVVTSNNAMLMFEGRDDNVVTAVQD